MKRTIFFLGLLVFGMSGCSTVNKSYVDERFSQLAQQDAAMENRLDVTEDQVASILTRVEGLETKTAALQSDMELVQEQAASAQSKAVAADKKAESAVRRTEADLKKKLQK
ncbi:MAG: hypothetical protein PF568_07750 [Deltaproteobacteria bacterium]|jgi:outer membrane murein-binding lipoprotein Lpp|nr:hypothetical protein [Deltaproteobacteria bacterium]